MGEERVIFGYKTQNFSAYRHQFKQQQFQEHPTAEQSSSSKQQPASSLPNFFNSQSKDCQNNSNK